MILNTIVSVFNKTNLKPFGKFLLKNNVKIHSSGGTFKTLRELNPQKYNHNNIVEISALTQSPEMLNGRVKTLHPTIHGGILAKNIPEHMEELQKYNIPSFDLVVVNLYPFQQTVQKKDATDDDIIENIDIGGHTLIRSAAKNYQRVLTIVDPDDYQFVMDNFNNITLDMRKKFAAKAFKHAAQYDIDINSYFNPDTITRQYTKEYNLKYGLNPQQKIAGVYRNLEQDKLPFKVLNGNPGYINFLDAIYSYALVNELKQVLNQTACASFKHTSPAGVGLSEPLTPILEKAYMVNDLILTPQATAYIRARNADPLCSFGDFVALNDRVDVCMAKLLAKHVSDGIVATGYEPEALEILKKKKKGAYVILEAYDTNQPDLEIRELHGMTLIQEKNKKQTELFHSFTNIVTENKDLPYKIMMDLILANTTTKYTQSNTIVAVHNGQVIAVGAGQQSRIDCMKLVKQKVTNWYMRQHLKTFDFMDNLMNMTHQEKVNAIASYIEYYMSDYRGSFMKTLSGVSVASDAFFPFNDNIEVASEFGCQYLIQPGGSIADKEIIDTCDKYGMLMCMTGADMRLFLH